MEYAVFTEKTVDQCYEWVPFSPGDATDQRMIFTEVTIFVIARMQIDGNDILGRFPVNGGICYAHRGTTEVKSSGGEYPCQRLRIMEGCTIFWVPYTARDLIPLRAVVVGHMSDGNTVYVTKFKYNSISLPGHYEEGAAHTVTTFSYGFRTSATMEMMVVL